MAFVRFLKMNLQIHSFSSLFQKHKIKASLFAAFKAVAKVYKTSCLLPEQLRFTAKLIEKWKKLPLLSLYFQQSVPFMAKPELLLPKMHLYKVLSHPMGTPNNRRRNLIGHCTCDRWISCDFVAVF